jgi:hypothetical protein
VCVCVCVVDVDTDMYVVWCGVVWYNMSGVCGEGGVNKSNRAASVARGPATGA